MLRKLNLKITYFLKQKIGYRFAMWLIRKNYTVGSADWELERGALRRIIDHQRNEIYRLEAENTSRYMRALRTTMGIK